VENPVEDTQTGDPSQSAGAPAAAYLPVGAVTPAYTPPGEPGVMPKDGQGTPYEEGEVEKLQETVPPNPE
jgi:hypothetical protein